MAPTAKLTKDEQQLVNITDLLLVSLWFTFAGLVMGLTCLVGSGTWAWYTASALLFAVSLFSAIQVFRLWFQRQELLRRGIKEPDFRRTAELESADHMLRPGDE
jgi:Kef-type K+ transport system membrane component KefB